MNDDDGDTWYSDLLAILALLILAGVVWVMEQVDRVWGDE